MKMSSSEEQQRTEFAKFSKFFTIRLIQSVVQSRLGQPLRTECSVVSDGSDWFNVRIEELGEVTSEIRSATGGRFPPVVSSLCLDFQIRTCDGETLPLESWCVSFDPSHCDPSVSIRTNLYHQMSTMLKSSIAASRMTPTYRYYARKQGPDSFILCYQIYEGLADRNLLGDGHRTVPLGYLTSPFGTLSLDLYYRTKMVISNDRIEDKKAQHTPNTPPRPVNQQYADPQVSVRSPTFECSPPDACYSTFSTSPASLDFGWGFGTSPSKVKSGHSGSSEESMTNTLPQPDLSTKRNSSSGSTMFRMEMSSSPKPHSYPDEQSPLKRKSSFPFEALLSASSAPTVTQSQSDVGESTNTKFNESTNTKCATPERPISPKEVKFDDDFDLDSSDDGFVKVPQNVFIGPEEDVNSDLGLFMRECKTAPPQLRSFDYPTFPIQQVAHSSSVDPKPSLPVDFLSSQLKEFQAQQSLFDNFVQSLKLEEGEGSDEEN